MSKGWYVLSGDPKLPTTRILRGPYKKRHFAFGVREEMERNSKGKTYWICEGKTVEGEV